MSVLEIDVDSSLPYFDELVQLESLEYLFEFWWSDRESCWYVHLYDQDENPLASSIKILLNVDLLRRFPDPRMPPGKLVCVAVGSDGSDITQQSDLGSRVFLEYVTSDDEALTG